MKILTKGKVTMNVDDAFVDKYKANGWSETAKTEPKVEATHTAEVKTEAVEPTTEAKPRKYRKAK